MLYSLRSNRRRNETKRSRIMELSKNEELEVSGEIKISSTGEKNKGTQKVIGKADG